MTESELAAHREQAKNRPKCCRKLANKYREIADVYSQHRERFRVAEEDALDIALIYELAGRDAGTWDDEEECES